MQTLGSQKGVRSRSRAKGTPPWTLRRRPRASCWKRFRWQVSTSGALRTPSHWVDPWHASTHFVFVARVYSHFRKLDATPEDWRSYLTLLVCYK